MADDVSKAKAEAQFRKAQQAKDGKAAMAEYEANAAAVRANTERLRALRMAREAADADAAKSAPPAPAKSKSAKKAKSPPGKLSEWLDTQQSSGRKTRAARLKAARGAARLRAARLEATRLKARLEVRRTTAWVRRGEHDGRHRAPCGPATVAYVLSHPRDREPHCCGMAADAT